MTIEHDPQFGCELAQGRSDGHGYVFHGRTRAHIAAWVATMGAVPDGHVLDHMCRHRNCVALHHLEPVTQSENERRKSMVYRLKRTHCKWGHVLAEHRVITDCGGVVCRACNREAEGART
jgi:hypothetical protein